MQFVNAIEILGLSEVPDVKSIDADTIKKARRKLIAEIDLSDEGYLPYYGLQLSKGDCEKVIDGLANDDIKEYYLYLFSNLPLNSFLVCGNASVFSNFRNDSIFQLPDFVRFVSPYFAHQLDRLLPMLFASGNAAQLNAVVNSTGLLTQADTVIAFRRLTVHLQEKIAAIQAITIAITTGTSQYNHDTLPGIADWVKQELPSGLINCLPPGFNAQVGQVLNAINDLSHAILTKFELFKVSYDLMEYIFTFEKIELDRTLFHENLAFISKKLDEQIGAEENRPVMEKWEDVLEKVKACKAAFERGEVVTGQLCMRFVNIVAIKELNELPAFGNRMKNQIAIVIYDTGIACWNTHRDLLNAIELIGLAAKIDISDHLKKSFLTGLLQLKSIAGEYKFAATCFFCDRNAPDEAAALIRIIYKQLPADRLGNAKVMQSTIGFPRCRKCRETHGQTNNKYQEYIFAFMIPGIILAIFLNWSIVFMAITGAAIGWVFGIMKDPKTVSGGCKDISDQTLSAHPLMEQKIREGWSLMNPYI